MNNNHQKQYSAVILDLDGTVLDTEKMNFLPLIRLIREELGREMAYEELLPYRALPGKKSLGLLGFRDIETSYAKWVDYVNTSGIKAEPYDGWSETLSVIGARGIPCAVASSKMKRQYEIDFSPTDLARFVRHAVLADDVENHKPHPEPLLKAAALLGVAPQTALYVGDAPSDYEAARAAGMGFALAQWGGIPLEASMRPDYLLARPQDLLRAFAITENAE